MRHLVLALVLLVSASAHADKQKAEQLFRTGEKAYRAQKFLAAAQSFELAYKELAAPEIAFSAAQAYRRQYRVDPSHPEYVELAVKYYRIYLDQRQTGGRVGDAADNLESMERELVRLGGASKVHRQSETKPLLGVAVVFADQQTSGGKLREVEEEGKSAVPETPVTAKIDGKVVEADVLHEVSDGEHVVRAEAAGYEPAEKRVRVVAGAPHLEDFTLQPLPAQLAIDTEAGATVIVDGRGVGEAPLAPVPLAGGSHVITIVHAGRKPAAREIVVERAEHKRVTIALEPTARRRAVRWVAIGSGSLAVLAGVTGLGALYWNGQAVDKRDLLQMGNQDKAVLDDYNHARTYRNGSITATWVLGGASVAVGLTALWLYYFDSPSAEGVRVVPQATGNSAGAMVFGRF